MQDSTCELRHSIETKDRKLGALSQMLQAHKKLFGSLEREALSLKQTLERTEHIVCEKEQVGMFLLRPFVSFFISYYENICAFCLYKDAWYATIHWLISGHFSVTELIRKMDLVTSYEEQCKGNFLFIFFVREVWEFEIELVISSHCYIFLFVSTVIQCLQS